MMLSIGFRTMKLRVHIVHFDDCMPDQLLNLSQIPNDVPTAENNNPFYESHMSSAEDFVYSDSDWTTMFIADIYNSKKDGNKIVKKVKLISSDGVSASLKYNKLVSNQLKNILIFYIIY